MDSRETEHPETITPPPDQTQNRERFNQVMKEVDLLIKHARFQEATTHLSAARAIDPGNPYVKAFEERIRVLEKGHKNSPAAQRPSSLPPQPIVKTTDTADLSGAGQKEPAVIDRSVIEAMLRKQIEEEFRERYAEEVRAAEYNASHLIEQEHEKILRQQERITAEYEKRLAEIQERLDGEYRAKLEIEIKQTEERLMNEREELLLAHEAEIIRKNRQEVRTEMDTNLVQRLERLQNEYERKIRLLGISVPQSENERRSFYSDRLRSAYESGAPSVEQARNLLELKELLELSYEEHLRLDSEVRLEQYVRSLERGLVAGTLDLQEPSSLEDLKKKYQILPEEALRIESYVLSNMMKYVHHGTILVADDEEDILTTIADALEAEGFRVFSCLSVKASLDKLSEEDVDLIVSDIKFGPGEPDGFKFFQTLQKSDKLRDIPFILLSSLTNDVIIRTGVELGVDNYLTKPIDPELLIAVIKGKLKRVHKNQEG